jgi:hypothetical protein
LKKSILKKADTELTMSSYTSIGAYRIALLTRSARTILVEGDTDVTVIKRLLLEKSLDRECAGSRPVIDRVALVNDAALSGLGNKCRVLTVSQAIPASAVKFRAFVDKEWSGYDFQQSSHVQFLENYNSTDNVWVTKGHSIENYFFDNNYYREYFLRNFGDKLSPQFFELVPEVLDSALNVAFAFSVAAREAELIERCGGVMSRSVLRLVGQHQISLDLTEVRRLLSNRGADEERLVLFAQEYENALQISVRDITDKSIIRWLAHGHLGDSVVWSAFSLFAIGLGLDEDSADQIQSGRRKEKISDGAHFIAQRADCEKAPLDALVEWAHEK